MVYIIIISNKKKKLKREKSLFVCMYSVLLPTMNAPYHVCFLPWLLSTMNAPYHECSLPWMLPTMNAPYHACSLPWLLPTMNAPYHECSLLSSTVQLIKLHNAVTFQMLHCVITFDEWQKLLNFVKSLV